MKKSKNRAFTLAEVMIVLTVIGVLSAILLPVAFHSTPDKNILKFKRAHNTFTAMFREFVSSEQYFLEGDLGKKPDGTVISIASAKKYYCESMADFLEVKEKDCVSACPYGTYARMLFSATGEAELTRLKISLDANCEIYSTLLPDTYEPNFVKMSDDVYFLQLVPFSNFELISPWHSSSCVDANGFAICYNYYCVDIDGPNGPIKPFGYGVRFDGKIVNGLRADWWLSRDITKKETDCCPKDLTGYNHSSVGTISMCDEGDTICAE